MKRGDGNTTRIVDNSIQELFITGECTLVDHCIDGGSMKRLKALFMNRLVIEHGLQFTDSISSVDMIVSDVVYYDYGRNYFRLYLR